VVRGMYFQFSNTLGLTSHFSWDPKFLALPSPSGGPLTSDIFPVVYQDPYQILKSTAALLQECPELSSHVRRLWFSGIYQFTNVTHIFDIIGRCDNVRSLTLPWSTLRYGAVGDWVYITNNLPRLTNLEFLGADLKKSQISGDANVEVNYKALEDVRVDFSKLRRLGIRGSSNVQPIVDADLWEIARTATNLEEIHITGTSSATIEGITALVSSAHKALKVLNYAPLDQMTAGFTHLNPSPGIPKIHFCDIITSCPNLTDVNVTVSHICEHILCPPPEYSEDIMALDTPQRVLKWHGNATIRLPYGGHTCVHPELPLEHPDNWAVLQSIFGTARKLQQKSLLVEFVIGNYTFNPATFSVSGDFREPKKLAEGMWEPEGEKESRRGPWGNSGVWEGMGSRWTEIGEEDFFNGVRCGLVKFEY